MKLKAKDYTEIDYILIPVLVSDFVSLAYIGLKILIALIPTIQLLTTSSFIDAAITAVTTKDISLVIVPLLSILGSISISWLSGNIVELLGIQIQLKLKEYLRTEITFKRSKLKYEYIEDSNSWDLITNVADKADEQIFKGFFTIIQTVQLLVQTASIIMILATQVLWASIVIIIFSIPLFYISLKSGKSNFEAYKNSNKFKRRADYYQSLIVGRESAEERALFAYTERMNDKWFERYEEARKINNNTNIRNFVRMKLASLITLVICFLIAIVLVFLLRDKLITIGMFMALINASFDLVHKMSWELSNITRDIANNHQYLKSLTSFMKIENQKGAEEVPDSNIFSANVETIEFRDVSFKYPFTDKYILKNMSFILKANRQYAFIGCNGAGKTTVLKLLTGLYSEFEGEILINGKNIQEYTLPQLKGLFSIVYQDFGKYQINLKDNVMLGNVNAGNEERVKDALMEVGLFDMIEELPDNIETILGKASSKGIDISGGQWQRIAIARSLLSDAPISILDEPTASIDPVAEKKIYHLFNKVCRKKMKIIITHRMGAAMLADEILVFDQGRIIEQGNHKDLVKNKGVYYDIYESQRRWYQ